MLERIFLELLVAHLTTGKADDRHPSGQSLIQCQVIEGRQELSVGQIAGRDGSRDLRHVAQLHSEVAGHGIHVVGEVLPSAGDALHMRLAAELTL